MWFFPPWQRENKCEELHKDQVRQEKRTKALKERLKKVAGVSGANKDNNDDEFFEDEEEENE